MIQHSKFIFLALALGACGSQVDGDHQGEVLARLEGTMHAAESRSIEADVSIAWVIGSGGTSFVGADRVQVEGTLPSNFTLSVFTPPADDVLWDWDGVTFATAYLVSNPPSDDPKAWQKWLGADMDHVLVYLPAKPPAGSDVAALLRGTPEPGYHLYNVHQITEPERQQRLACWNTLSDRSLPSVFANCGGTPNDDLIPADDDLDTLLSIEIVPQFGLDEFNALPAWYGLI